MNELPNKEGNFVNDNVIIKITDIKNIPKLTFPLLKKKQFTGKILNDIIAKKLDFNVELYKYTDYDIFAYYMIKIYMNTYDDKLIKYIIDNNYYQLNNTLFSPEQSHILRNFNFNIIKYLIDKGVVFIDIELLYDVKEDIMLKILSYAIMYNKPFIIRINIFDPTNIKCWKIFNYKLLELYIEKSDLKYNDNKEFDNNYSKDILKNLLIDNNNMDLNNKLEITKLFIEKLNISK
jgi:hypothetical protein